MRFSPRMVAGKAYPELSRLLRIGTLCCVMIGGHPKRQLHTRIGTLGRKIHVNFTHFGEHANNRTVSNPLIPFLNHGEPLIALMSTPSRRQKKRTHQKPKIRKPKSAFVFEKQFLFWRFSGGQQCGEVTFGLTKGKYRACKMKAAPNSVEGDGFVHNCKFYNVPFVP